MQKDGLGNETGSEAGTEGRAGGRGVCLRVLGVVKMVLCGLCSFNQCHQWGSLTWALPAQSLKGTNGKEKQWQTMGS